MKFTILQQDLLPKLQSVSRSVGIRSTLPVLDNILLSVEGSPRGEAGGKLKIAATNLEIGVIKFILVEDSENGEITVPAKTIVDLVSGLSQSRISFETEGENLAVSSNKFKAKINGISSSEFPAIPLSSGKGVNFPKEALKSCSQILFASAVDEGRPVLTGILTTSGDDKLDFVATDGFRLAHRQATLPKGAEVFKSLIPRRTFEEVLRIMDEEEVEEVNVAVSENQNQAIFTLGGTIISSRLIEGQFPSWEKIIPTQIAARVIVDKEELLRAIKLAAVFAKNEANILILNIKKNLLNLKSFAKELGSQENEIESDTEGDEIEVAFNAKFLQDVISNIPSTQVIIEFSGPLSAALIKPIGIEGLEYIVMPVRLN